MNGNNRIPLTENFSMIVFTFRVLICFFALPLVFCQTAVAVDHPFDHLYSGCGNRMSHGIHQTWKNHGSHPMCEPYLEDLSLNDFSTTYNISDGLWCGGSPVRVSSRRDKTVSSLPRRIQNNKPATKWIANPFYGED